MICFALGRRSASKNGQCPVYPSSRASALSPRERWVTEEASRRNIFVREGNPALLVRSRRQQDLQRLRLSSGLRSVVGREEVQGVAGLQYPLAALVEDTDQERETVDLCRCGQLNERHQRAVCTRRRQGRNASLSFIDTTSQILVQEPVSRDGDWPWVLFADHDAVTRLG